MRLAYLNKHGNLSRAESDNFAEALWSEVDKNEQSLPANTNLLLSTFAELPAPASIDVEARVRHRLVRHDWVKGLAASRGTADIANIQNLLVALHNLKPQGLRLGAADAQALFDLLVAWRPKAAAHNDPNCLIPMHKSFVDGVRMRIGDAISVSVAPFLSDSDLTDGGAHPLFWDLLGRSMRGVLFRHSFHS